MYALVSFFGFATVGGSGAGQVNPVYGASTAAAKKATKGNARLRGAGVIRYWVDNARPFGETQSHAGVARWGKVQW
jgi:hypothetical protein